MAAAVPALVGGGIGLLSKAFGGGSSPASAAQSTATGSTLGQAGFLGSTANPLLSRAAGYYQALLGNSRAGLQTAIAPQVNSIADTYRGAEAGITQQGLRGGAKDMAVANLERDKAGAIGALPLQAKSAAAGAGGQLGATLSGQSLGGYQGLLGVGENARQFNVGQSNLTGQGLGSLTAQILQSTGGKKNPASASVTGEPLASAGG